MEGATNIIIIDDDDDGTEYNQRNNVQELECRNNHWDADIIREITGWTENIVRTTLNPPSHEPLPMPLPYVFKDYNHFEKFVHVIIKRVSCLYRGISSATFSIYSMVAKYEAWAKIQQKLLQPTQRISVNLIDVGYEHHPKYTLLTLYCYGKL